MIALHQGLAATTEAFDAGELVELFILDASMIGGGLERFAPAPVDGGNPIFAGATYQVVPFESDGWLWSSDGPLPTPTLTFKIAREDDDTLSIASYLLSLVNGLDDLIGCRVTRLVTLRKYLDDGAEPDPNGHFPLEVYEVEQKSEQTGSSITFQLSAGLDQEDVELPRKKAVNICGHDYRVPDGQGGFDYSRATCPYNGAAMFDAQNQSVNDPAEDRCAHILSACRLRFGQKAELPYDGYPGVGRIRAQA